MKTPEEEAKEIYDKIWVEIPILNANDIAKTIALIQVDGIIEELELFNYKLTPLLSERIRHYQSIRQAIEKM